MEDTYGMPQNENATQRSIDTMGKHTSEDDGWGATCGSYPLLCPNQVLKLLRSFLVKT